MKASCDRSKKGRLFVISGPSGSGKSTLARMAVERTGVKLSISATTRAKGDDEVDGRDYYFLSEAEFLQKIETGEFLEYARVFDNYYGTPRGSVAEQLEQGQIVVLEIDVQGAGQVFEKFSPAEVEGILILPPSDEELRRRLESRGRDDDETIDKRLAKAQWEIKKAGASGNYGHTIVNDDLEKAADELVELLL